MALKRYRMLHGLTMKQVGKVIGVSESCYSLIENGKRGLRLPRAKKLADYYGITVDELIADDRSQETA